jgi:hypothetical protein
MKSTQQDLEDLRMLSKKHQGDEQQISSSYNASHGNKSGSHVKKQYNDQKRDNIEANKNQEEGKPPDHPHNSSYSQIFKN